MKSILLFLVSIYCFTSFGQELQTIDYEVQTKETVYSIAKKFNTTVQKIQTDNPSILSGGLQTGQLIKITTTTNLVPKYNVAPNPATHVVQASETLFSIARKYNVAVQDLESLNSETLKEGLQTGNKINIPTKKKTLDGKPRIITNETTFHKVATGETKFSIAKEYGITIEQLEKQNPEIINRLIAGNILAINKKGINPNNEREELMIALAEKQAEVEKNKAQAAKIENLEDQLVVKEAMNQKIIKLNSINFDLTSIDNSKGTSIDKLKLILDSNKNLQEVITSKLDSLVIDMYTELDVLKNSDIDDVETYRKLQKETQANRFETSKMIQTLKQDLNTSRKNYVLMMTKVQRLNLAQEQELKRRTRTIKELEEEKRQEEEQIKKITALQDQNDVTTESLFFKLESLEKEKEIEITRRIEKATFYSAKAREFDDRMAIQQLIRYQKKLQEESKTAPVVYTPLTAQEVKDKIKEGNFSNKQEIKREHLSKISQIEPLFYVVLKVTSDPDERDAFTKKLSNAGEWNTRFFYDLPSFSYYIYTNAFATFDEAYLEVKLNEKSPLFQKVIITEIEE